MSKRMEDQLSWRVCQRLKRYRWYCFCRAAWLAIGMVRKPWWDKEEPYCNIGLKTAWEIGRDIWLI